MSQYERVFRILGPIIGFALLYYVLTGAAVTCSEANWPSSIRQTSGGRSAGCY